MSDSEVSALVAAVKRGGDSAILECLRELLFAVSHSSRVNALLNAFWQHSHSDVWDIIARTQNTIVLEAASGSRVKGTVTTVRVSEDMPACFGGKGPGAKMRQIAEGTWRPYDFKEWDL